MDEEKRKLLTAQVVERLEYFYTHTREFRTNPSLDPTPIREHIAQHPLLDGLPAEQALEIVFSGLEQYAVHTPHPRYFGLYNPRSSFAGILADWITATYNPQMAAWSHAPFAGEVENWVISEIGQKFGFKTSEIDGVFSSGGAEANLTAILCALNATYPDYARTGLRGIDHMPLIFCSAEAHHSIHKAARTAGLGSAAVINIPVDQHLRMDIDQLEKALKNHTSETRRPMMIIATGGTTGQGVIDPLDEVAQVARTHGLWYHVDAAFGGGCALSSTYAHLLHGIAQADSITFDAHKWMSVPMGTSMLITRHKDILASTFRIQTDYMPKDAGTLTIHDPFAHSIQWSRRFNGLKVYLSLLMYGWKGFEQAINHHMAMGDHLREQLKKSGWKIMNPTQLPVVCFTHPAHEGDPNFTTKMLQYILQQGRAWISVYPVNGQSTFRACITNYNTQPEDIQALIQQLNEAKEHYASIPG